MTVKAAFRGIPHLYSPTKTNKQNTRNPGARVVESGLRWGSIPQLVLAPYFMSQQHYATERNKSLTFQTILFSLFAENPMLRLLGEASYLGATSQEKLGGGHSCPLCLCPKGFATAFN